MAFWDRGREAWRMRRAYLGASKEVFDAGVFAILRATQSFNERGEMGRQYSIFSDTQSATARVTHDGCGPAQALAKAVLA